MVLTTACSRQDSKSAVLIPPRALSRILENVLNIAPTTLVRRALPTYVARIRDTNSSVVTSNIHETTFCCFEKISFKVYYRKQKGKLDILLFPVVLVQSKLDISTKNPAIMLE